MNNHVDIPQLSGLQSVISQRRSPAIFVALSAVLMIGFNTSPATAQDADKGRYVLERTENGVIRLDTLTGEVSKCGEVNGQIACKLAVDERRAVNDRIAELENRVSALEDRIVNLDNSTVDPKSLKPLAPKTNDMPSDEELDQVFNMMERFMHRFIDVFKDLDRKMDKPESPSEPIPEKT